MAADLPGYPVDSIYITVNTQSSLSEAVTLVSGAHLFAVLYIFIVWMIKVSDTTKTVGLLRFYVFCHDSEILEN